MKSAYRTMPHIVNNSLNEWMQTAVRHVKSNKHLSFFFFLKVKDASDTEASLDEFSRSRKEKTCIIHGKTVNVSASFPCFSTHFSSCLVMLNF